MPSPLIIITVGLPGSGKSTWLESRTAAPISSDSIRQLLADDATDQTIHARVFATMRFLLRHRLAIGRPVTYVDATHLTPEERAPYIRIAHAYGCEIEAVFFDVSPEVCRERNAHRNRVVPDEAIALMAAKLAPPSTGEGFARITVVR
ncbi:MAG: AAA family ATPase [Bryobacteraceae bacterium]